MIDENPLMTARRLSRRKDQNRCLICGRRIGIAQHHVAGKNHDPPFTTPLCQGHHDLTHENLQKAGVDLRHEKNKVERVRKALRATSVFLSMLAEALWRWAESLSA